MRRLKLIIIFAVLFSFLYPNIIWAIPGNPADCNRTSEQTLAATNQIPDVVRYLLDASCAVLVRAECGLRITDMRTLLVKQGEFWQQAKRGAKKFAGAGNIDDFIPFIFAGVDGGTARYFFNFKEGVFYRVIDSRNVDDLFWRPLKDSVGEGEVLGSITVDTINYSMRKYRIPEDPAVLVYLCNCINQAYPSLNPAKPSSVFKNGYEPIMPVPEGIAVKTSSLTAAILTKTNLRGGARGLDKKADKARIQGIKDEADGLAKKIYERIIKAFNVILRIRVSEGFGRDEVAESFKANDAVVPDNVTEATQMDDAIVDVIEGTNAFVYDVDGKKLSELKDSEAGATSIIATGKGVESIGNCPDIYTDGIFTIVPKDKRKDFVDNPLDPEITAADPTKIEEDLKRIADANNISIGDMEVVLMDRTREGGRLTVLKDLQLKYPGLEVVTIKDGTVAHSLLATFGRKQGKHKVVMTVGGAPEGFLNLAVASIFREEGAVASIRIYSKNVNKDEEGKDAQDLSGRYNFSGKEKDEIRKLRPQDCEDIIKGKKLFTQEYVRGDVEGSFAFITNNGVFRIEGARQLENGNYLVTILRVGKVNGIPCVWFEDKVFKKSQLDYSEIGHKTVEQGSHIIMETVKSEGGPELVFELKDNGVEGEGSEAEKINIVLEQIEGIYGEGILVNVNEVRVGDIVDNLHLYANGRSPLATFYREGDRYIIRLNRIIFDYPTVLLRQELGHEFFESIGMMIPGNNEVMADIVATLENVKRFLVDTEGDQDALLNILRGKNPIDPDRLYLRLLERLLEIKRQGKLTEHVIIAGVIQYVMKTKVYANVRGGLGLSEGLDRRLRELDILTNDVLQVFNTIIEARDAARKIKEQGEKTMVGKAPIIGTKLPRDWLSVFEELKQNLERSGVEELIIDDLNVLLRSKGVRRLVVHKTAVPKLQANLSRFLRIIKDAPGTITGLDFWGYMKMTGLGVSVVKNDDGIGIAIGEGESHMWGAVEELFRIQGEPINNVEKKYILVEEAYKKKFEAEYTDLVQNLRSANIEIRHVLPEGVKQEDVIRYITDASLLDQYKGEKTLFLLFPYSKVGLGLAARIVVLGGDVSSDPILTSLIRGLYGLDDTITDEQLKSLFTEPWGYTKVTESLEILSVVVRLTSIAA